jgi:uncharacterized protein (UPF0248 family)
LKEEGEDEMIPIRQILSRIRWDSEFGAANFEIGYYDRIEDRIILVPFSDLVFPEDRADSVIVMDYEGENHAIPLHRIKEVYRDRQLIWQRRH